MKTLIAFVAGVIIASASVYLYLESRPTQTAAASTAASTAPAAVTGKEVPPPAERIVIDPKPSPATAPTVTKPSPARFIPTVEPVRVAVAVAPTQPPPAVERPVERPVEQAPPPPVVQQPEPTIERTPNTVTLAANTQLTVRLAQTISTERDMPGDEFTATLDQPLVVDGFLIAERGTRLEGRIVASDRAGRVRGTAHLELELTKLNTADGQHLNIRTNTYQREGESSRRDDATKVGIGAAVGAAIGAIAGGGKGAAIGAGAGGAAGAGTVLATRGKDAVLPVESRVSFRLLLPITITERLQ